MLLSAQQASDGRLPLLWQENCRRLFAYNEGREIDVATFLNDVKKTVPQLSQHQYVVNTCQNRYHFIVSFAAALCSGKTTLLPSSGAKNAIDEILGDYFDSCLLSDSPTEEHPEPDILLDTSALSACVVDEDGNQACDVPLINASHIAAVTFTSGSTGKPEGHEMSWHKLSYSARLLDSELNKKLAATDPIVATVPPQHMFGLETSVMLPLQSQHPFYIPKSFYPAEVQAALGATKTNGLLVTTPVHLKVLNRADIKYPKSAMVLSATAPLDQNLAADCERIFSCTVEEIYGSSETGAVAMRRTATDRYWQLLDEVKLESSDGGAVVTAPGLTAGVYLSDVIEKCGEHRFRLIGRGQDVVKIAGKRQSLASLNNLLQSVDGVDDAVVFCPPENSGDKQTETMRLAALVVSSGLTAVQINAQLRQSVDPVFIPRPLYFVDSLPRNATGKLPVGALNDLWNRVRLEREDSI